MPQFAAAVVDTPTPFPPRCASANRAVAETIGLLPMPNSIRHRRFDGLMMSSNLDTAGLPDTASQSSLPATREMRSPSELSSRLLALFVRPRQCARRLPRSNRACASLIGQCTSSPTSLTRVVGCAGTARLSCYYKHTAFSCRHFVGRNKTVRRSVLFDSKLRKVVSMNNDRSCTVGDTSSSTDSLPEPYGHNLPPPDVLHGCPSRPPRRFCGPLSGFRPAQSRRVWSSP